MAGARYKTSPHRDSGLDRAQGHETAPGRLQALPETLRGPGVSQRPRARVRSGERGQAAVMSALGLFTMVIFLALAANTGILVNDRIRMQNASDLTAYAGAYTQATSLNVMAGINSDMYKMVQRLRAVLNYGPTYVVTDNPDELPVFYWQQPACSCLDYSQDAQDMIEFYQRRLDAMADKIDEVNASAPEDAANAATRTARANFLYDLAGNGLTGPDHLSFFQNNPSSPTNSGTLVDLDRVETTMVGYNFLRSCRCCDGCCVYPQQHVEAINSWVYKTDTGKVYFPAKLKGVPIKNFLDIKRHARPFFGADATPARGGSDMLYGYAAAKPFEGNVGTSNPDNANEGGSFIPQNPIYPPSDDLETSDSSVDYFRPTYRTRLAGIHENMGASTSPASMADLIRTDSEEPQFKDKADFFAH